MNERYYYTCDLEDTAAASGKAVLSTGALEGVRDLVSEAVASAFGPGALRSLPFEEIRAYFRSLRSPDEFVVSLDDATYVPDADAYFDSTRTYRSIADVSGGAYDVMRRDGSPLSGQAADIVRRAKASGKDVVVCDDGIFSGDTVRAVLGELKAAGLRVKAVRVALNFSKSATLDGTPIQAYESPEKFIDWIDERDFFYGVKNGGASFCGPDGAVRGVPYVYSPEIAERKATIDRARFAEFRDLTLAANAQLWDVVSRARGSVVSLLELPRVAWLAGNPSAPMADVVAGLAKPGFGRSSAA